eukprot:694516-Amphidinium_carterae.1
MSQDMLPSAVQATATPPCEALCSSLLDVVPTAWLQLPMRCQSELPRRSLTLVAAALCWLHSIVEDPRHGVSQRSAAELIIALAPRCLWPEPPREKGQQLPPNARPQLIQQRVQVLYSGNWAELLDPLVRNLPEPRPDHTTSTRRGPQTPGLIQPGDARRILQTAQDGRVTTAWNQLFGYGLARSKPNGATQPWLVQPLTIFHVPSRRTWNSFMPPNGCWRSANGSNIGHVRMPLDGRNALCHRSWDANKRCLSSRHT